MYMGKISQNISFLLILFFLICSIQACGGSSSGSGGVLIEGILTEGSGTDHNSRIKHGANESIEEVMVCALGKCSRTDGKGQWGFYIEEENFEHTVLFSVDGHGINTTVTLSFPHDTNEAFIHFEHNHGKVIIHHMNINGTQAHSHEADHGNNNEGHDHNHG